MTDIPDDLVLRQIKRQMHCHCKFHNAEIRRQVSSGNRDLADQKISYLICQDRKLLRLQFFYVIYLIYFFQDHKPYLYFSLWIKESKSCSKNLFFSGRDDRRSTAVTEIRSTSCFALSSPS